MFTGIVERTGTLVRSEVRPGGRRLVIERGEDPPTSAGEFVAPVAEGPSAEGPSAEGSSAEGPWDRLEIGESIAVDGCCLTLVEFGDRTLAFDVIEESLRCTTLGDRAEGDALNLERALRIGDRLGGHLVTGHVDGTGRVVEVRADAEETRVTVEIDADAPVRVIHKGSITIDGISLTVAAVEGRRFTVALIPHTLEITNLSDRTVGDRVNLEMDQIGRWVEVLLRESGVLPPRSEDTRVGGSS